MNYILRQMFSLLKASKSGDITEVENLIAAGVNVTDKNGDTPLHMACQRGS